jgi:hypothetical protein
MYADEFTSPYDQYREHNGKAFTVLGEVDRSTYDADEVGTMYHIRLADGTEITAWPEEIVAADIRRWRGR